MPSPVGRENEHPQMETKHKTGKKLKTPRPIVELRSAQIMSPLSILAIHPSPQQSLIQALLFNLSFH
jgi:hypothetical protein